MGFMAQTNTCTAPSLANVMVWTAPAPASRAIENCAKMVVVEQPSEGAPSMGKSITDLSSVTTVGLDLANGRHDPHQQAEDMTAPTIKRNAAKNPLISGRSR